MDPYETLKSRFSHISYVDQVIGAISSRVFTVKAERGKFKVKPLDGFRWQTVAIVHGQDGEEEIEVHEGMLEDCIEAMLDWKSSN